MKPRSQVPATDEGGYFKRGEKASFNITNLVEDTLEGVTSFLLRFAYTTWMLIWSPRTVVFHILKHNRWFRITRPYSYCFAAFFFLILAFTIANTFKSETAAGLKELFGGSFSFAEFAKSPNASTVLLSSTPALLSLLIVTWFSAVLTSPILIPRRRVRRLLSPIYFGLTYIVSLLFMTLAFLAIAEFLLRILLKPPSAVRGTLIGPDFLFYEMRVFVVFAVLLMLLGITLARLLWTFSSVASKPGTSLLIRLVRSALAWFVASLFLWGAVGLAAFISIGVRVVSAGPDPSAVPGPQPKISCVSFLGEWIGESAFVGTGANPLFSQKFSEKPLLGSLLEFVLINDGDTDFDLKQDTLLWGQTATCPDLQNAQSCRNDDRCPSCRTRLGKGQIVEPKPVGGVVIVPKKGMLGINVKVVEIFLSASLAQYISPPEFEFASARFPALNAMKDNHCRPYEVTQQRFFREFNGSRQALPQHP